MQFKHPELLYALLLLLIPIFIHLFQLRKFKKEVFTNVKLLKTVQLQTRKSAKLKQWLTLLSRLLLLAFAVLAFAQPFIPNTKDFNKAQETVVYLDNSFSMEVKGARGTLLNEAVQDILTHFPQNETITLFTNNKTFKNTTVKTLQNDLLQLPLSPNQMSFNAAFLKGRQLFKSQADTQKNLVLISDFQLQDSPLSFSKDSIINLNLVQLKPNSIPNTSIDSVYVSKTSAETLDITVALNDLGSIKNDVTVSLFNNDTLQSKSVVTIDNDSKTVFTIPNQGYNGKLMISDESLTYDNNFYFNINKHPKIKVLAINNSSDDTFLKRIYTDDEFEFKSFDIDQLNFNLIPDQNLILLNELYTISNALATALQAFKKDGGHIVIIPSETINKVNYNKCLLLLGLPKYIDSFNTQKNIISINYNHPLLANAFYTKVNNFQYPKVEKGFKLSSNLNSVLSYEDSSSFISGIDGSYIFSAALNSNNSNFTNSQLIVPILYNFGIHSLKLSKLYYTIGEQNTISINTSIGQDDILSLESKGNSVIPLQRTYSKSVTLETDELPNSAGIFEVKNKQATLQNLSFNFNRNESRLNYYNLETIEGASINTSLSETIKSIKSSTSVNALWKWFAIFALLFLVIELLLLKYLK